MATFFVDRKAITAENHPLILTQPARVDTVVRRVLGVRRDVAMKDEVVHAFPAELTYAERAPEPTRTASRNLQSNDPEQSVEERDR